jgi:hypothetical protein
MGVSENWVPPRFMVISWLYQFFYGMCISGHGIPPFGSLGFSSVPSDVEFPSVLWHGGLQQVSPSMPMMPGNAAANLAEKKSKYVEMHNALDLYLKKTHIIVYYSK